MTRVLALALIGICLALAVACSDDDGPSPTDGSGSPTAESSSIDADQAALRELLASVLLQESELPPGLEGGAPAFSTNADLAGKNEEAMAKLIAAGRQLGADVQFLPTDRLDPAEPAKGGFLSSVSVYTAPDGASLTFQETAAAARMNDWPANYPDLEDVKVEELARTIGDESLWLRVTGLEECEAINTNTPDADGVAPSTACIGERLVVLDNVIFRVGRVRAFIMVSSLVSVGAAPDIYANQVEAYANIVTGRARTAFPAS